MCDKPCQGCRDGDEWCACGGSPSTNVVRARVVRVSAPPQVALLDPDTARGGMGKVMQEIVLNIVNMNLMFWIMWFLSESDFCQPLRNVVADIIAASLETLEGEDYQKSEFAQQAEHIDNVKIMEEMVMEQAGEVSKNEYLLPAIIFCTMVMAGGGFYVWHKFKVAAELQELQKSRHFKKEVQKVSGGKAGKEGKKKK